MSRSTADYIRHSSTPAPSRRRWPRSTRSPWRRSVGSRSRPSLRIRSVPWLTAEECRQRPRICLAAGPYAVGWEGDGESSVSVPDREGNGRTAGITEVVVRELQRLRVDEDVTPVVDLAAV